MHLNAMILRVVSFEKSLKNKSLSKLNNEKENKGGGKRKNNFEFI